MKKTKIASAVLAFMVASTTVTYGETAPDIDYMSAMIRCAESGSLYEFQLGSLYEELRNNKIDAEGLEYRKTNYFSEYNPENVLSNLNLYNSVENERIKNLTKKYYTEEEVVMMAKVLYRECRGLPKEEMACVAWVVCNRVDCDGYADTIKDVIKQPNQFAYRENTPVWDDLYELSKDVLDRWSRERNGEVNVGRVLPKDYLWFAGNETTNWFRNSYKGGARWDYSLPSPYND